MTKEFSPPPKTLPSQSSHTIWGGRFSLPPSEVMQKINDSVEVGKRLWQEDIAGSRAHCEMLVRQQILSEAEGLAILQGLDLITEEIREGRFDFKIALEDIHMNVEHRLKELIGETAGKLHTARSRNDQVATDFRLWVRQACDEITKELTSFQEVLERLCLEYEQTIMPGFTHLQTAQPVTLAMHLDAYRQMLERDKSRFADCRKRLNESPLGACALSGTGFPVDRDLTAQKLGFDRPMSNTLDAVSARDFACEFLFAAAQCGLHLSRLAEEIILWTTPQFGFLRLSDAWTTGSSIMPQKKNPDAAELVRAKTGRLNGNLLQLMTVMKALPLAYNKDMQEDKACVFESFDTLCLCLEAMKGMVETAEFLRDNMRKAAETGYATATEIADWLVRNLNIPFREAHRITGKIVKIAEQKHCQPDQLPLADMQTVEPGITSDIYRVLSLENAVQSRKNPLKYKSLP